MVQGQAMYIINKCIKYIKKYSNGSTWMHEQLMLSRKIAEPSMFPEKQRWHSGGNFPRWLKFKP